MALKPIYNWDEENYTASCILPYRDNIFYGIACAHPDDQDFAGQITGCNIAEIRANIQLLMHRRDNEIIPGLKALKQLYYSMSKSTRFNEKSYENKMLQRQICIFEDDLSTIKEMLINLRKELKFYIDEKDKHFKQIRALRAKKDNLSS